MDLSASRTGGWRHRLSIPTLALVVLIGGIGVTSVARGWLDSGRATAEPTSTTLAPTTTIVPAKPVPQVPVETTLATPKGQISTFDGPNGTQVGTTGYWYGYAVTLPVVARQPGWLRVRLPERPNGSMAWVHSEDVSLSTTPYRIVIRRGNTDLTVYQGGFPLLTIPAGLGKSSTPTPLGSFFVGVIESPGPSGYGPIVLDTSGHSEAIQSWEGAGDVVIAIHGPITSGADAQIGTTGTYVSNGCIRLHPADQVKLSMIPLGTPIDIVA